MPKAILELEMPESCHDCQLRNYINLPIGSRGYISETILICYISGKRCVGEGRRPDCPLKPVEG